MEDLKRQQQIEHHRAEIRRLQEEARPATTSSWPPSGFYLTWHVMVGMVLGVLAAAVSLSANLLAAPLFGHRPLDLIRAYLTFPMGARALTLESGMTLTIGCVLYLATGAVLGVFVHLILAVFFRDVPTARRFAIASVLGLGIWIVGFYLILSWLQPMLLGGSWIVSSIPWWVAMLTHLAFAWSMAAGESFGHDRWAS